MFVLTTNLKIKSFYVHLRSKIIVSVNQTISDLGPILFIFYQRGDLGKKIEISLCYIY